MKILRQWISKCYMLREENQMQQICRTYLHHVACLKSLFHCSQCSRQLFFVFDTTIGSKNNYPTHWCQDVNHISTSAREITVITIWVVFLAASLMVTYWVVWFGCGEFISIYWPCVERGSHRGGCLINYPDETLTLICDPGPSGVKWLCRWTNQCRRTTIVWEMHF